MGDHCSPKSPGSSSNDGCGAGRGEDNVFTLESIGASVPEGGHMVRKDRPSGRDSRRKNSHENRRMPSRDSNRDSATMDRSVSKDSRTSRASRVSHVAAKAVVEVVHKVDPLTATVMIAGSLLACCAGMTNMVAFKEFGKLVSHVTGSIAKSGAHIEDGKMAQARDLLMLVFSFATGSSICGCMISKNTVSFRHSLYGLALVCNAILHIIAILSGRTSAAPYILAAACGLQNGMATSYSGAVIRTTHATGLFTDVGLIIGRSFIAAMRRLHAWSKANPTDADPWADFRKLILLLMLAASFLTGTILSAAIHASLGVNTLFIPAFLTGTLGTSYSIYRLCVLHKPLLPQASSDDDGTNQSEEQGHQAPLDSWRISIMESREEEEEEAIDAKRLSCARSPREKLPISSFIAELDKFEPTLAELGSGGVPGTADLQMEALEAHRRFRSALVELSQNSSGT